jgi:hypothetical protein
VATVTWIVTGSLLLAGLALSLNEIVKVSPPEKPLGLLLSPLLHCATLKQDQDEEIGRNN